MIGGSANRVRAMRVAMPGAAERPEGRDPWPLRGDQDGQQRERRDGPADVGDVDREEAAAADVPEPERQRQPDRDGEDQRGGRQQELLDEVVEDAARAGPVGGGGEVVPDVSEHSHRSHPRPGPGSDQTLHTDDEQVEEHRDRHAQQAGGEELGLEVGEHPVGDQVAEAAVGDQRAHRGQRHRRDRRHPQPGHHDREGQGQLDPRQLGRRAVAQAAGRLAYVVRHRPQAVEDAAHQDGQRVERQPDDHRGGGDARERHQQREERQRGDGVEGGARRRAIPVSRRA